VVADTFGFAKSRERVVFEHPADSKAAAIKSAKVEDFMRISWNALRETRETNQ
jgi:hypothetical protein